MQIFAICASATTNKVICMGDWNPWQLLSDLQIFQCDLLGKIAFQYKKTHTWQPDWQVIVHAHKVLKARH